MTHDSFECPDVDALISSSVRLIPIKMFSEAFIWPGDTHNQCTILVFQFVEQSLHAGVCREWVLHTQCCVTSWVSHPVAFENAGENSICRDCIVVCLNFLADFLSSPTIRSWWSQWAVMATCLCYSWWRWWSETLWRKSNAYWIFGLKTNLGSNSCTTCMQQAWRAIYLWCLEIQAAICSKPGCPNFMSYGMSTMLICNVVTFLFHNLALFFIPWHGNKFLAHCHGSL